MTMGVVFLISFGSGPGQFQYPGGLAVDSSGDVYVAMCVYG